MLLRTWPLSLVIVTLLSLSFPSAWAQEATAEASPEASVKKPAEELVLPDPNPGIQAPTISGLTGLFRLVSCDIGSPHTFRVGLHTEAFKSSDFLVRGDANTRFIGTLAGSYTPWPYSEFFINIRSTANNNDRTNEAGRLDQPLILALGDLSFGAKGQYPLLPALALGMNLGFTLLNSVGGVSFDADSTGFYIGMLSTFDLGALSSFPLRFHLNLGYQLDNSNNLAGFANYSLASLQVEKFALGLYPSRMQLKLGTDLPLRRWTGFGLTPIIELAADIATGDADPDFDMKKFGKPTGPLAMEDFEGRTALWMTIGLRTTPVRGFNVELASDIGMLSPGFSYGPPVPPWNLIFGLSYAYDPAPPTRVVTREKVTAVEKKVGDAAGKGKYRGRVINAETLEPVEGALVTFPGKDLTGLSSDPDGTFLSYDLTPGEHPLMVRHPDYSTVKMSILIKAGAIASQDVKLTASIGKVVGQVADTKGTPVSAAVVATGPEERQVSADSSGSFSLALKPGTYTLSVVAPGYLRKSQSVTVGGGKDISLSFALSKRPLQSLVTVTKNQIVIRRQVHFASGTAAIQPDSQQLLDAVADTLLSQPNIKQVEVQGHTDSQGTDLINNQLSQARATAVVAYLVKSGVSRDRLVAKGYGSSKPKAPNISPRNRAINRRVEFMILEQ